MPSDIVKTKEDEQIWNRAKSIFKKSYGREPQGIDFKIVMTIFKKISQAHKLLEQGTLKEDFVDDMKHFLWKNLNNPILTLLIVRYISKLLGKQNIGDTHMKKEMIGQLIQTPSGSAKVLKVDADGVTVKLLDNGKQVFYDHDTIKQYNESVKQKIIKLKDKFIVKIDDSNGNDRIIGKFDSDEEADEFVKQYAKQHDIGKDSKFITYKTDKESVKQRILKIKEEFGDKSEHFITIKTRMMSIEEAEEFSEQLQKIHSDEILEVKVK